MASKNNNKIIVKINKDLNHKFNQKDNDNEDLDTEIENNKDINNATITNINNNLTNDFNPKDNNNNKDLDNEFMNGEKKLIFVVKILGIIVSSLFLIAVFIIYMLHLILPENKRWLTTNDILEIKSIAVAVASGIFSSLASSYFFNSKK